MERKTERWSFLGMPRPRWSLALGWGVVYSLPLAYFVGVTILRWAPYAGWYGFYVGWIALAMSIKHKSCVLMSFAVMEMFSYIIILGFNTP